MCCTSRWLFVCPLLLVVCSYACLPSAPGALAAGGTLQVGWGCHWRLVYLLYTGQQQSISMFTALQQAQAMFQARYPDFSDWLAR